METRTVSAPRALELQAVLSAVQVGKVKLSESMLALKAKGNIMLVDPLNGDPFVFVAPDTVHVFQSKPGSGTDHIRQRINADLHFQRLTNEQPAKEPEHA